MEFIAGKFPYTQAQVEKDRGSERKKVRAERDGKRRGQKKKNISTQAGSEQAGRQDPKR